MAIATDARLDTLAEFPGAGDLSLTRALVRYREVQAVDGSGEAIDDIGLAVIVDGEYPAAAEAVDLGSGRLRHLDLSTEVVVLDWVYASTLDYIRLLLRMPEDLPTPADAGRPIRRYGESIALGVLARIGFDPLTRPCILRLGFRDLVRDLDPNERPRIRISAPAIGRIEARLDCDHNTLVIAHQKPGGDAELQRLLGTAFPGASVRRVQAATPAQYQVRLPLPISLDDARDLLDAIRAGVLALFAHFEPERHLTAENALDVFGPRDTLARLDREPAAPPSAGPFAPGAVADPAAAGAA